MMNPLDATGMEKSDVSMICDALRQAKQVASNGQSTAHATLSQPPDAWALPFLDRHYASLQQLYDIHLDSLDPLRIWGNALNPRFGTILSTGKAKTQNVVAACGRQYQNVTGTDDVKRCMKA